MTAVEDGTEALSALVEGPYDLLLAAIVMPELDGISLALMVAKVYPDMLVLLMSGYAGERQRARNLDALINEVIPKPFSLKDITAAVARVLAVREELEH